MASARSFPSTVESRESLHRITAFGDRGRGLFYGTVQILLRIRMFGQQLGNGLEPEQQTVEALQQGVVKVSRNPRTLSDACVQGHLELMTQPPEPQLVGRPQQRQEEHSAQGAERIRLVIRGRDGDLQRIPCSFHTPLLLDAITRKRYWRGGRFVYWT